MATSFADLQKNLSKYLSPEEIERISSAYRLAEKAHQSQVRSTGEPYISHPLAVASILAGMRMDADGIIAALLHDVLEDSSIDKTALANEFGKEVADLVDGVSKLTQIHFKNREEAQAENFRKMVLALALDIRVILIKLADRLHNMRTLYALDKERRIRIAQETLEIYAPIAYRLGINRFRVEFEDRAFTTLFPLRSKVLEKAIRKLRGNREKILQKIEKALKLAFEQEGIPVNIYGREKHLYGIYQKMKRKHLSLEEVMDVVAFRIIVDKVDTCYRALGAVHNLYKPVPGRFKDYIAIPKSNGYQSLHTILFGPNGAPIEVQIRTEEMQQLAEHGIAGHWLYKSRDMMPQQPEVAAKGWVRGLLEIQKATGSSLEFIENVKIDLFPDEVYLFTPKGKIMELPRGATAVDFAYAVHTDLGNTCIAAKVDKRLAPLSTRLVSGQTVEIITAPKAHPNPSWLNYVVTAKARSSIRHFLKNQQQTESVQLGKRLLEKALQNHPATLSHLFTGALERLAAEYGFKHSQDLLEDIGLGNRPALLIARRLIARLGGESPSEGVLGVSTPLTIKGTERMVVHYAKCCHPIPGDPIEGYLSTGRGIVIHMESCKNTVSFQRRPEKHVPVQWEAHIEGEFPVEIKMQLENRKGVLAQVALAISECGSNIDDIRTEDVDGQHTNLIIILSVRDRAHLAEIIRKIRRVKSVAKIARYRS